MGTGSGEILILLGIVLIIPFAILAVGWIFYRKIKAEQEAKSRLPITAYGDPHEGQGFNDSLWQDKMKKNPRKDAR